MIENFTLNIKDQTIFGNFNADGILNSYQIDINSPLINNISINGLYHGSNFGEYCNAIIDEVTNRFPNQRWLEAALFLNTEKVQYVRYLYKNMYCVIQQDNIEVLRIDNNGVERIDINTFPEYKLKYFKLMIDKIIDNFINTIVANVIVHLARHNDDGKIKCMLSLNRCIQGYIGYESYITKKQAAQFGLKLAINKYYCSVLESLRD